MKSRISCKKAVAVAALLLAVMLQPMTLKAEDSQKTVGTASGTVQLTAKEARKAARRTLRGYKAFVEAGAFLNVTTYSQVYPDLWWGEPVSVRSRNGNKIELTTIHGYQFNNFFFMGAGLSMDYYTEAKKFSVPLFANARVNFLNKKVTPFVDVKLGGVMGSYKGVYLAGAVGCRIAWKQKSAIVCSIEIFEHDGIENIFKDMMDNDFMSGCGLKVGYEF